MLYEVITVITYLSGSKTYYFSQIKTIRIEKFLFWNFCITIDLEPNGSKRNVVSFSSYGHTEEIYKKLCKKAKNSINS